MVSPRCDPVTEWIAAGQRCGSAWVVAPETGGILLRAVLGLRRGGVRVWAPDAWSLRTFCDKAATGEALGRLSIATPPDLDQNPPAMGRPGVPGARLGGQTTRQLRMRRRLVARGWVIGLGRGGAG